MQRILECHQEMKQVPGKDTGYQEGMQMAGFQKAVTDQIKASDYIISSVY